MATNIGYAQVRPTNDNIHILMINWKLLSEEMPPAGAFVLIDTGSAVFLGWVTDVGALGGFERWALVTRHDGSVPEMPNRYTDGIKLEG